MRVRMLYICPYYYVCVRMLQYMCPLYAQIDPQFDPLSHSPAGEHDTALCVSSHYYICILILLHMRSLVFAALSVCTELMHAILLTKDLRSHMRAHA
jgi:hypothetical protein